MGKSMLNPQSMLFSSPLRSTGSSLVPKTVSEFMTSHTRSSSTTTKLHLGHPKSMLLILPSKSTPSLQLQSVAPPSSGPRTNNTCTPVSPMDKSESSPSSTPTEKNFDDKPSITIRMIYPHKS